MDLRRRLLWIDGSGGLIVGVLVLLISGWLSELHNLPRNLLLFTGGANLAYGSYSLSLASRSERPRSFILFLVIANLSWAVVCFVLAYIYFDAVTVFGLAHLIGEGLYVGGLACLEWRWRELLRKA